MRTDPINMLYVEDDKADAEFAHLTFQEIGCKNINLHVVGDGEEASTYLGVSGDAKPKSLKPDVVLLDLNLPKIHGKDLLKRIKQSNHLNKVPVVILSTSDYQKDIDETYRLGAAGYFIKPADLMEYKAIFQTICDYWGKRAKLPSTQD